MHRISFDVPILHHCPAFRVGVVTAKVAAGRSPSTLIDEMNREADRLIQTCDLPAIKEIPAIAATRSCYKRTGKDPNRYRPSAEQLSRRVVRGLGLYYINALVDIGNLLSLRTGYSIGVFDRDKVGSDIVFGVGYADEPFVGIGRGELNIEGLPVYRDENGAFATPTSDHERTSVDDITKNTLIFINDFGVDRTHSDCLEEAVAEAVRLLKLYAGASDISTQIVSAEDGAEDGADPVFLTIPH
ncbi:B3/B4 domain-containing protein [Porphyromonas gingivalis]|uniref:B3/B4 domain-containing protein n=1 Tax=Porphyromonas gingivalis TaxID=837 RepID=UPI00097CDDBA|nr:phenylalanine--tRNA ligase beta subunit-related protein [Porphyromonas gingivalis]SJM18716.1 hypothetical protein PGIN_15-9_01665 [Porphyromonas gingivalis]